MKDVKAITIPDSRYRQLEYIHFNGAEYIIENFNLSAKNRKMVLDYTADTWVNNTTLLGQYDNNSVADNTRRLYIVRQATTSGNQLVHCMGSTWGAAVNAAVNTRYLSTITYTNASTNTLKVNIKNVDTGQILADTSFSGTGTSIQSFGAIGTLGACVNKLTDGTFTRNGFWKGKLYKFEKYVDSTGDLQNSQVPCQRKSDGVCGLYDIIADLFFPMTGTTITDAAAGPVVNENMPVNVKKIESNNQIIWGSQSAFPYRRLEYIHLNGAEWVYLDAGPLYPKNRAIWIKADSDVSGSRRALGSYDNSVGDAGRRYYFLVNRDNGFGFCLGNTWIGGKATAHAYDKVLLYGTIDNTGKKTSWGVKSFDDVTNYASGSITTTIVLATGKKLCIGATGNNNATPGDLGFKGNVYRYLTKTTNGSGPIEADLYPCQRKSDGTCGLYDVKTNTFFAMEGTTIGDSAAGPVLDEYWDLTAPA